MDVAGGCCHGRKEWAGRRWIGLADPYASRDLGVLGRLGGHELTVTQLAANSFDKAMFRIELKGAPRAHVQLTRDKLSQPDVGLIRQLENRAVTLPRFAADVSQRKAEAQARIAQATRTLERGFKHEDALDETREKAAGRNCSATRNRNRKRSQ